MRLSSSALRAGGTAQPVPMWPVPLSPPLSAATPLWRKTPGLQHCPAHTRELSKRTAAGAGQIKIRKCADSLMVLAVTGQSSSIWSCIKNCKEKIHIKKNPICYSHNVQSNATKITQEILKTSDRLLAPSESSIYLLEASLIKGFSSKLWISLTL